jgi:hypothetical protein
MSIRQVAEALATRLFAKDDRGQRTVFGYSAKMQKDPHFRDCILFNEYFDGDTGRGVGASHQTGWTSLIALLLDPRWRTALSPCPRQSRQLRPA